MLIWLWKQFESQSRRLLVPATGDLQRHWGLWGQPCSLGARPARSRGRVRVIQHRGTLTSYRKFPNFSFVLYLAHELQEAVCPRPKLLATISRDVTVWMVPPSKREAAPKPFVVCGASISQDGDLSRPTQLPLCVCLES